MAKLEKDQNTWQRFKAAEADYSSTQKVSKVEYLRTQDQALSQKVSEVADVMFPVKFLGQSDKIAPFVGSSTQTWSESKMIPPSSLFTVYICNLTSLGSSSAKSVKECVRLIADACALCPERSMGIIFGPNVAGHGHTYDEKELETCHDDCEAHVKQDGLDLKTRRGQLVFALESISSRTRSSVHPMWLCISNQVNADGEMVSRFANSEIWRRRAVHGIQMKTVANFVVPFTGTTPVLPGNLSKSQMHKQHIAGIDLWDKVRENLWKGMGLTPSHGCAMVDLLPYDDSLLLSSVQCLAKNRPKEPQEMVISCSWARGDQDGDKRRPNVEWLTDAIRRSMDRFVRSKLLVLEGFDYKDFSPEGTAPVNDVQLYALTFPTAEGHLAMKQTALDEWSVKFARTKKDFDEAVDKHNKKFNPSGFPYKADGQKRAAPVTEDDGEEGAAFTDDCIVASLDELKKSDGKLCIVRSFLSHVQLVFTSTGALYLHALESGVVSSKRPLCQIFGEYHSGEAEVQKANKRKVQLVNWKMTSMDDVAVWGHPAEWDPPFKAGLASFKEFVAYLADHNVVTFTMVCHELELDPSSQSITSTEDCFFEPKKLPPKAVADQGNSGSLVAWSSVDWDKRESKNGQLKMHFKLMYEDSSQGKGIYPNKPVWIMAKTHKVEKGKCYKVVPAPGES